MSERDFLKTLGRRIRDARMSKQLTQAECADLCKIEKASLSRLEAGKSNPTVLTLLKVTRGLNMPVSFLFFEGGSPQGLDKAKTNV